MEITICEINDEFEDLWRKSARRKFTSKQYVRISRTASCNRQCLSSDDTLSSSRREVRKVNRLRLQRSFLSNWENALRAPEETRSCPNKPQTTEAGVRIRESTGELKKMKL